MSNGCVGSVQVYGTTYYFSDKDIYNEIISHNGDATAQKELIETYQTRYGTRIISTDENELVDFAVLNENDEEGIVVGGKKGLDVESYNEFAAGTGLSSIDEDSSVDDLIAVFKQIETSIKNVERAIQTLDTSSPEKIDSVMSDIDVLIESTATLGSSMGLNLPSSRAANNAMITVGGCAAIAAGSAALAAGSAAALGTATLTIGTAALAVPGPGWVIAGVCGLALIGIGIYSHFKNKEAEEKFEQLKQDLQAASDTLQNDKNAVKDAIKDELEGKIISDVKDELGGLLTGEFDFDNMQSLADITQNLGKIMINQAEIETWAALCEKHDITIDGLDELREALGTEDDMNKCANEYIAQFAEYTKNNINSTGEVVADTGSFVASAYDIQELVNAIACSETMSRLNYKPLLDLIEFIQQTNQDDVYNDAGAIGDGMYSGGGDYNFGGYSDAYTSAGENKTGVDNAVTDGQYDVDTSKYDEVQKEAQEAAQKDIDEYLDDIEISGKSVEDLEELYETTKADLDDFSQYKENLDLDLSGFDTVFSNIRKEQQARVDEYISSVAYSGKSLGELEELHSEVSAQGEAFKKASSEVDTSAFDDVLSNIRSEQQSIVDKKADELSSKVQSGSSLSQLTSLVSEIEQYTDSVSGYSVNTGKLSAISDIAKGKIQTVADEKAASYEIKAAGVKTSDDCIVLADVINIEISQFQGTGADTSGLQKIVADLVSKANVLRIEEAKKKAEEDAANTSTSTSGTADTLAGSNGSDTADAAQTPMLLPADDGEMPVPDGDMPVEDGETPAEGDNDGTNVDNTGAPGGEDAVPPEGTEEGTGGDITTPPAGEDTTGEVQPPAANEGEEGVNPPAANEDTVPETPNNADEGEGAVIPPVPSTSTEEGSVNPPASTEDSASTGSGGITSVGQADETTPPPNTNNVSGEVEQIVQDGLEEGKTPEEIADLIEIEVEE